MVLPVGQMYVSLCSWYMNFSSVNIMRFSVLLVAAFLKSGIWAFIPMS